MRTMFIYTSHIGRYDIAQLITFKNSIYGLQRNLRTVSGPTNI